MKVSFNLLNPNRKKKNGLEWKKALVLTLLQTASTLAPSMALYCTVLYCTVLYCTVLYCTVLYYSVLY